MSNLERAIEEASQEAIQAYHDILDRAIQGLVSAGYSLDRIQLAYLVEPFSAEIWVDGKARYKVDGTWHGNEFRLSAKPVETRC